MIGEELGFKNFVDLYENLSSSRLLVLDSWVSLIAPAGNATNLKSPDQLMAEIDQKAGEDLIIIQYHIQDFAADPRKKLTALSKIMDSLKTSEKYVFMTERQYQETLNVDSTPTPDGTPRPPTLPDWAVFLIVGASATVGTTILLTRRYGGSKKLSSSKSRNGRQSQ
jgi:hypothetical protein